MAASFSTLTTRAVAASLDKMPSDQIAALPASVRQKIITEPAAAKTLTDDALRHLGGGHTELSLRGSRVTDRGLGLAITAANSSKLVQLDLSHCTRLRDAGIIALVQRIGPQLRSLDVSHCRLSDAAFEAIATCCGSSLKSLDCSWNGSGVGERTVHALAKHCGELESLALCGCRARDDSLIKLACACPKLAKLNTRGCEALSEAGIVAALCTLPRIRKLDLCQIHKLSEPSVHVLLGARSPANCMHTQHTHTAKCMRMHFSPLLPSFLVLLL